MQRRNPWRMTCAMTRRRARRSRVRCCFADWMQRCWRTAATPARSRQDQQGRRQRMLVKSRDGEDCHVKLAEHVRVAAMVKVVARRHQGRLVHRRVGHAAAGRHQKAYAIHIFLEAQKRRRGDGYRPLGQPARQHHDQRQCRHHRRRQGRPGHLGQIQGRREEDSSCRRTRRSWLMFLARATN